ncbi:M16 family metallopeptidase [Streptomyces muensis]|uniref:Insulinase family protein n=1 Tax=Streptomyces muensis TaxID=1077944 RepID=A0A9X1Q034_STRM4|nr:insulinase family protein [Streptomyces muensis]MCF1596642.1 insulinase family protein [Streptomyces muensis]
MSLRLESGLRLVTEEAPGRGLVAVALTVAAGGDDDPVGRHGMAHLVEHLMFPRDQSPGFASGAESASGSGDDESFVALVQEVGGMCNAETHRDHTVFHTVVPADALPEVLAHEARRLLRFEPSPETVRSEVAVIGEEIRAAGSGSRLWDTVLTALHPGARDAYGTTAELRRATAGEAETFFRRHYRPERAVLSVVGDVDAGLVGELVEREFEAWGREACGRGDRDSRAAARVVGRARGGDEPRPAIPYGRNGVAVGHALADPRRGLGPYLAQVVLCEILRRGRLRRLAAERGAVDAASVMCGYQGQWLASAAPDLALVLLGRAPGVGTEEAAALWLDALGALAAAPPDGPELRRAVTVLRAACHRQADSLTARAVTHGRAALLFPSEGDGDSSSAGKGDGDGAGPDAIPRRLAAVTAADVSSAARALLAAPRTVHTLEGVAP